MKELPPEMLPDMLGLVNESLSEEYPIEVLQLLHQAWPRGQLLMIAPDGEVMGFLLGSWVDREEARIMMFAIRPHYRSMGMGSMLMQNFLRRVGARGGKAVRLEVRPDNHRAIEFYQRWGFQVIGLVPEYYRDGGDGLLMRRLISGTSDPRYAGYVSSMEISLSASRRRQTTVRACRIRNAP